ncbi:MAG: class I SAM-dependent methyltransferase [Conexibacter sp.]
MITPATVHHPLFARFYANVLARSEPAEMTACRVELVVGLTGRVLELGAGAGANLVHYPASVTEVVAVEPEPYLRERLREAATQVPVPVTVADGVADAIPVGDASCDAAVASLVLCSVPHQAAALAELRRVLRPGGELRFFEHVRGATPRMTRWQAIADRTFWPRAFGGCHTNRDTVAAIAAAGFAIESERRLDGALPRFLPVVPHVLGRARRP